MDKIGLTGLFLLSVLVLTGCVTLQDAPRDRFAPPTRRAYLYESTHKRDESTASSRGNVLHSSEVAKPACDSNADIDHLPWYLRESYRHCEPLDP